MCVNSYLFLLLNIEMYECYKKQIIVIIHCAFAGQI